MRIVKGRVVAAGSVPSYNPVINEYDGSPVSLDGGDIILAITVSNGNATPAGSASPYIPEQFTEGTGTLTLSLNTAPVYTNGEWLATQSTGTVISAVFTAAEINSGKATPLRGAATQVAVGSGSTSRWLNGGSLTTAFEGGPSADGGGFVHVTLLVMNPILAQ
jgi:hypothetical protein